MERDQSRPPARISAGDLANAAVRGSLSAIPAIGNLAAEFYGLVVESPLAKRRNEWFESLARRLSELQLRFEELGENPSFVTTVARAAQAAVRTHQSEKLDLLRNVVENCALGRSPETDLQCMFFNFIDEFTPTHMAILSLVQNRGPSNQPQLRSLIQQREITDQMVLDRSEERRVG